MDKHFKVKVKFKKGGDLAGQYRDGSQTKMGSGCRFKQMAVAKKSIKNKFNENSLNKLIRTCLVATKN